MDDVKPSPPEVCICWLERVVLQSDQSFRLFENLSCSTGYERTKKWEIGSPPVLAPYLVLWNKKNVRKIGKGKESKTIVRVHHQHK